MISFSSSPFYVCSHLTLVFLPLSLTFQPWRNLEAIPPLRLSGSHLTRSITLCLFQLNLTPFAVRSIVIPCRKVTQPYCTHFPGGFHCFSMYIMLLQEDLYCQTAVQKLNVQSSLCQITHARQVLVKKWETIKRPHTAKNMSGKVWVIPFSAKPFH